MTDGLGGNPGTVDVRAVYRTLLRVWVAPALRQLGLKGTGKTYYIPSDSHFATISFQESLDGAQGEIEFTINVRVADKTQWRAYANRAGYTEAAPAPNAEYVNDPVSWYTRAGLLADDPHDQWWTVDRDVDVESVAAEVVALLTNSVVPAMKARLISP
ncbi:MAG TPA: DUF4304 domain-containing protein [Marmoricola sp.]|nr:DUF4304 domain-containing protein [Marmoricola sp.]